MYYWSVLTVCFAWSALHLCCSKSLKRNKFVSAGRHHVAKRQVEDEPEAAPSQEYFSNSYLAFAQQSYEPSRSAASSSNEASSTYSFPERIRYASLTDPASTQAPTRLPTTTQPSRYRGQTYRGGISSSNSQQNPASSSYSYYYRQPNPVNNYQQSTFSSNRGSMSQSQSSSNPYGFGQSSYQSAYPSAHQASQAYNPYSNSQSYSNGYGGYAGSRSRNPQTAYSGNDIRIGSSSTRYDPTESTSRSSSGMFGNQASNSGFAYSSNNLNYPYGSTASPANVYSGYYGRTGANQRYNSHTNAYSQRYGLNPYSSSYASSPYSQSGSMSSANQNHFGASNAYENQYGATPYNQQGTHSGAMRQISPSQGSFPSNFGGTYGSQTSASRYSQPSSSELSYSSFSSNYPSGSSSGLSASSTSQYGNPSSSQSNSNSFNSPYHSSVSTSFRNPDSTFSNSISQNQNSGLSYPGSSGNSRSSYSNPGSSAGNSGLFPDSSNGNSASAAGYRNSGSTYNRAGSTYSNVPGSPYGNAASSTYGNAASSTYGNGASSTYGNGAGSTFGNAGSSPYGNAASSTYGNAAGSTYGNSAGSTYGNGAGSTYGNAASSTYGNGASSTYGNSAGSTHGNSAGSTYGNGASSAYGNAASSTYGNGASSTYGNSAGSTHGNSAGSTYDNGASSTYGNTVGSTYGSAPDSTYSNVAGSTYGNFRTSQSVSSQGSSSSQTPQRSSNAGSTHGSSVSSYYAAASYDSSSIGSSRGTSTSDPTQQIQYYDAGGLASSNAAEDDAPSNAESYEHENIGTGSSSNSISAPSQSLYDPNGLLTSGIPYHSNSVGSSNVYDDSATQHNYDAGPSQGSAATAGSSYGSSASSLFAAPVGSYSTSQSASVYAHNNGPGASQVSVSSVSRETGSNPLTETGVGIGSSSSSSSSSRLNSNPSNYPNYFQSYGSVNGNNAGIPSLVQLNRDATGTEPRSVGSQSTGSNQPSHVSYVSQRGSTHFTTLSSEEAEPEQVWQNVLVQHSPDPSNASNSSFPSPQPDSVKYSYGSYDVSNYVGSYQQQATYGEQLNAETEASEPSSRSGNPYELPRRSRHRQRTSPPAATAATQQRGRSLPPTVSRTPPIVVGPTGPNAHLGSRQNYSSHRPILHRLTHSVQSSPWQQHTSSTGLPDIYVDDRKLITSFNLDRKPLSTLTCARGAGCLSTSASHPSSQNSMQRKLLRFQTTVHNIGTAPFLPHLDKSQWLWHACHNHSHSMGVFTHYDLLDMRTREKVAEGHKASFCLEDSSCQGRIRKVYDCDRGHQGISPGCEDTYKASIDCQWIDVTDVPQGEYYFRITVNPGRKVLESNFANNGLECQAQIKRFAAKIWNCQQVGV